MYLDYLVDIPEVKGKITYRSKGNARYVYYEHNRNYDSDRKYTIVKRVAIGKVHSGDETKMRPNENFRKYFPGAEVPEEAEDAVRSSCLKAGTYMAIKKTVEDLELDKKLEGIFGAEAAGIILDPASYDVRAKTPALLKTAQYIVCI